MDRRRIAIVIPALNEAATIDAVVRRAATHGSPVVVDDGSHDRTAELASAAGADVVRHPANRGYDEALNSGVARAAELECEYFVTMDADGQHDPTIIDSFIKALDEGADMAVGIRDRRQRIAESVFGWLTNARWGIRDPQCGMKAYKIELYKDLGHFDSYGSIGSELTLFAARRGKRITQLPVKTSGRLGEPRFGQSLSANKRILRACWIGMFPRLWRFER